MTPRGPHLAAVLVALLAACAPGASAGTLSWVAHFSGATGHYVYDQPTSMLWWDSGFDWRQGGWSARVLLPLVVRDSPLLTLGPGGPVPTGGPVRERLAAPAGPADERPPVQTLDVVDPDWHWGVADPLLSVSWRPEAARWRPEFVAGVKIPDVASVGFGTGEWDGWCSAGLRRVLGERAMLEVRCARTWWGDPAGLDLRDAWSGLLRLTRRVGPGMSASAFATLEGQPIAGYDALASLGGGLERRFPGGVRSELLLAIGLTRTAADVEGSLRFELPLLGDGAR